MKKFNYLLKKIFFSFFFLAFGFLKAYAADSSNWIVAAEEFSFTQKNITDSSDLQAAKLIPQLLLEQLAQNMTRTPRAQEQLDRKLYELRKSRLDLFLKLSKEMQSRDALVLKDYSQSVLNSKLRESQKKIEAIEDQIHENLSSVQDLIKEYEPKLELEKNRKDQIERGEIVNEREKGGVVDFFKEFIPGKRETVTFEDVTLYQNDYTALFSPGEDKKKDGYDSYLFEKACVDSKINGLITGKITKYSSYVSVSVTMLQFPGAKVIANAIEVGSIEELRTIAISLANQLTPKIADSMPVDLFFKVGPEEALKNTIITVDDVVYRGVPDKLIVHSGVHTIQISSSGYTSLNTVYSFKGFRSFEISVELNPESPGQANLYLKNPIEGSIFTNGIFASKVSPVERKSCISINNQNILGHFVGENGFASDFFIKSKYLTDQINLIVKVNPFDRSSYIDKRRKIMYASYSGLIISLMPTFFVYGNYVAAANACNSSSSAILYEAASGWETANYITTGVSVACGAFFIYELVRYLMAANTVLPQEVKPAKNSQIDLIKLQQDNARNEQLSDDEQFLEINNENISENIEK